MITKILLVVWGILLFTTEIPAQENKIAAISIRDFASNPWEFEPSKDLFLQHYGYLLKSEQFAIKNKLNPSQKDTIIRLFKGKSEIFLYKPYNNKAHLINANILDKKIILKGGICIGMAKQEMYKRIAYPQTSDDTLVISLPDGKYKTKIICKENKIWQIKIEAQNNTLNPGQKIKQ
jgi:hypothetical protein